MRQDAPRRDGPPAPRHCCPARFALHPLPFTREQPHATSEVEADKPSRRSPTKSTSRTSAHTPRYGHTCTRTIACAHPLVPLQFRSVCVSIFTLHAYTHTRTANNEGGTGVGEASARDHTRPSGTARPGASGPRSSPLHVAGSRLASLRVWNTVRVHPRVTRIAGHSRKLSYGLWTQPSASRPAGAGRC